MSLKVEVLVKLTARTSELVLGDMSRIHFEEYTFVVETIDARYSIWFVNLFV